MSLPQQHQEQKLNPALQKQVSEGIVDPSKFPEGLKITRAEAPLLAEAIRQTPKLTTLRLSDCFLNEHSLQLIIDAAATHPELEHLGLRGNTISKDTAKVLGDALQEFRQLKSLRLRNTEITAPALEPILDSLRNHPTLEWVNFGQNVLAGDAARDICETMQTIPTLQHFNMMSSGLSAQDAQPIATAVRKLPNLMHLHLHDNTGFENLDARATIVEALLDSPHPNLHSVVDKIPDNSLRDLLSKNDERAYELRHKIIKTEGNFQNLRTADMAQISERFPILTRQSDTTGNELINRLKGFLSENLPNLGDDETPSPTRLFSEDSRGLTVLDNPSTWKQFSTLAERLETAGFTVNTTLLNGQNSRGETWLECGLASAPQEVLSTLNDRHIRLQGKELLTEEGNASPAFKAIIDSGNVRPLFTQRNWQGGNTRHIQQAYDLLPDDLKRQVGVITLKQQVSSAQRGNSGLGR